ncbi:DNA repair protein RecN [Leptospira wolffii]|uniref:DNA repair protein RecN n=1 Tax=Leptospira wolffii TaxID=409998 RepID=UPI00108280A0|nr:DNA repair protein RecN [Leptospira wolffii]TGK59999.1 DNA repair protein RecN [Leptospira wolffii]TGK70011.1 DNA repair protein RecN [Leptospira wolffii]TGK76007.1 DNA repair protein RecN [Leptospira wolffii]TGL30258.1 DNA repair protein RecN [Leptospira wolffii]
MLQTLTIRDFALIESAQIDWSRGLTSITGETGSGKSLLLDALCSLLGGKSTAMDIRTGADRYALEAGFDISGNPAAKEWLAEKGFSSEGNLVVIRKEFSRDGKTKIQINHSLSSAQVLRSLGEILAEVHNQNDQILLLDKAQQLDILDSHAGLHPLRGEVKEAFYTYKSLKKRLEELESTHADKNRKKEILQYQIEEIQTANLKDGEEEELSQEENLLTHGEKLTENLEIITGYLSETESSIIGVFPKILGASDKIKTLSESLLELDSSLKEVYVTIREINTSAQDQKDEVYFSPDRLAHVQTRLDLIQKLKKKYGSTIQEILSTKKKAEDELGALEQNLDSKVSLEKEMKRAAEKLTQLCLKLSKSRREVLHGFETRLKSELEMLGMQGAGIQVVLRWETSPEGEVEAQGKSYLVNELGLDQAEFYFSPNPGEKPRPLRKIASGGEISRVMLAIKSVLGSNYDGKVLVLDEIDSGLGGEIAMDVAKKLRVLSKTHQIVLVTHLQQIAAAADHHLLVSKHVKEGRTISEANFLGMQERTLELARMISGQNISRGALDHAKELLKKKAV